MRLRSDAGPPVAYPVGQGAVRVEHAVCRQRTDAEDRALGRLAGRRLASRFAAKRGLPPRLVEVRSAENL